jgi:hypothetical protein
MLDRISEQAVSGRPSALRLSLGALLGWHGNRNLPSQFDRMRCMPMADG